MLFLSHIRTNFTASFTCQVLSSLLAALYPAFTSNSRAQLSAAMIEWLWCLEMYVDYVCPDIKSKCCNFWVTATFCSEDMVGAALVGMILKTGRLAVFTFSLCWLWTAMFFLLVVLRLFKDWMRMVETLLGNMEESCGVELLEQSLTLLEADHDVMGTGGGWDVCCLNMLLDKF